MINLLPGAAKKVIVKDYRARIFSVFLFILSVAAIIIGFLFLPVYVLVSSQVEIYEKSASEAALEVADFASLTNTLTATNQMAQQVIQLRDLDSFAGTIDLIQKNQTTAIELDLMEFSRDTTGIVSVVINGKADTRQSLSQFRDRLLALPGVADVILPLSNLAKNQDIEFTISVVLNTNI